MTPPTPQSSKNSETSPRSSSCVTAARACTRCEGDVLCVRLVRRHCATWLLPAGAPARVRPSGSLAPASPLLRTPGMLLRQVQWHAGCAGRNCRPAQSAFAATSEESASGARAVTRAAPHGTDCAGTVLRSRPRGLASTPGVSRTSGALPEPQGSVCAYSGLPELSARCPPSSFTGNPTPCDHDQVRFADSGPNAGERGQTNAENKLFVGGVPSGCGEKELRALFGSYGDVQDVYILASKYGAQEGQRGCAFVRYASPQVRRAKAPLLPLPDPTPRLRLTSHHALRSLIGFHRLSVMRGRHQLSPRQVRDEGGRAAFGSPLRGSSQESQQWGKQHVRRWRPLRRLARGPSALARRPRRTERGPSGRLANGTMEPWRLGVAAGRAGRHGWLPTVDDGSDGATRRGLQLPAAAAAIAARFEPIPATLAAATAQAAAAAACHGLRRHLIRRRRVYPPTTDGCRVGASQQFGVD